MYEPHQESVVKNPYEIETIIIMVVLILGCFSLGQSKRTTRLMKASGCRRKKVLGGRTRRLLCEVLFYSPTGRLFFWRFLGDVLCSRTGEVPKPGEDVRK